MVGSRSIVEAKAQNFILVQHRPRVDNVEVFEFDRLLMQD